MDGEFIPFDEFEQDAKFPHKSSGSVIEDTGTGFMTGLQAGVGIALDFTDPKRPVISSPLYNLPQATALVLGGIRLGAYLEYNELTGKVDVAGLVTTAAMGTAIDTAFTENAPTIQADAVAEVKGDLANAATNTDGAGMVAFNDVLTYPPGSIGAKLQEAPDDVTAAVNAALNTFLQNIMYPVGSLYFSATSLANPNAILGFGVWTAVAGRVLVGLDATQTEFDTLLETGGAKTHTLSITEIPSHTHGINTEAVGLRSPADYSRATYTTASVENEYNGVTLSAGSGGAHNNLQPYLVVSIWRRVE